VKRLLLLCLLGACATASKEALHSETKKAKEAERKVEQRIDTHEEKGPEVILDFEPLPPGVPSSPDSLGLPPHGPLKRARLKGPSTKDLVALAQAQAKEHEESASRSEAQKESSSKPALSCAFGGAIWVLAILALVLLWRKS
jgi:hypothetical protein